MERIDPEKAAIAIRTRLSTEMITQKHFCEEHGFNLDLFNKYLRRKINLLDTDIQRALKALGINNLVQKLSATAGSTLELDTDVVLQK